VRAGWLALLALVPSLAGCFEGPCDPNYFLEWNDPALALAAWSQLNGTGLPEVAGLHSPDLPASAAVSGLDLTIAGGTLHIEADPSHSYGPVAHRIYVFGNQSRPDVLALVNATYAGRPPTGFPDGLERRNSTLVRTAPGRIETRGPAWVWLGPLESNLTLRAFAIRPGPWVPDRDWNGGPEGGSYQWSAPGVVAQIKVGVRSYRIADAPPYSDAGHAYIDPVGRAWYGMGSSADEASAIAHVHGILPDANLTAVQVHNYPLCA